jgi:glycosyltransferase involved in cell wall biosynthesis
MRIAQVAPLQESIPPKFYGGTERVISWLTEELVASGCDVTLFASGDSITNASLVPVCPHPLRLSQSHCPIDQSAALASLLETIGDMADEFDLIHCHLDWMHLPLLTRLKVPFVTTLHGRLDDPFLRSIARSFPTVPFVSVSNDQRTPLKHLNWIDTIYHGLPEHLLLPTSQSEDYVAFLGRIAPEKGPDVAIRIAQAAGVSLRMAAKIPRGHLSYFEEQIEPFLDGQQVDFVGEVNELQKAQLLGAARALLFPIDWPEPFGLVMIEAMACGTPVIAWRRGSVPEIITHGVTGFIVDNETEAIEAIERIGELDRRRIRSVFEQRFTARRMADDYLRCFDNFLSGWRRGSSTRSCDAKESAMPRNPSPLLRSGQGLPHG